MANYIIKGETLTNIADAIRNKTGDNQPITAEQMANKINKISQSGQENLNEVLTEQEEKIAQLLSILDTKGAGGEDQEITLQSKTTTPTKESQLVSFDDGYDGLESVTVNPIPDEYIIPSGDLAITNNGTHDVTNYSSVTVSVAGEGGGDSNEELDAFVAITQNTATDFTSDKITKIGKYAFAYKAVKSISLPNLTSSAERAFTNCDSMTTLSIPNMTGATQTYMAAYCAAMTSVDVKNASSVSTYSFYGCSNLTKIEFNRISSIAGNAFNGCTKLATLILRKGSVVTLSATSAFTGTKIAGSGGYIYVPKTLDDGSDGVETYKAASNWSTYAGRFRAIEDYPSVCG